MSDIMAIGLLRGKEVKAKVVNPAGFFGRVFLLQIDDRFDPVYYAVEADSYDDAIEEFVESKFADASVLIDATGPEKDDYAWKFDADDHAARKEYENLGTIPEGVAFAVTLGNKLVLATDPQYKFLATPELSGSGVLYDDDNVFVYGDENTGWKCRYYSEGWAEGGVCPVMFAEYGVDLVEGD